MRLKKIAFGVGVILVLVAPALMYFLTRATAPATLALTAALGFTALTRIDELAELSLGPLRAKMRETIAEAAATIDQLRQVAVTSSRAILTDLMAANFMSGMTLRKRFELHDEIIAALDSIGASEAQKELARTEWKKGITVIYHRAIRKAVRADPNIDEKRRINLANGLEGLMWFDQWTAAAPEKFTAYFKENQYEPPAHITQWLDDYRHYLDTGSVRRLSDFVQQ
jgi:hypothetical protein